MRARNSSLSMIGVQGGGSLALRARRVAVAIPTFHVSRYSAGARAAIISRIIRSAELMWPRAPRQRQLWCTAANTLLGAQFLDRSRRVGALAARVNVTKSCAGS